MSNSLWNDADNMRKGDTIIVRSELYAYSLYDFKDQFSNLIRNFNSLCNERTESFIESMIT